MSNAALLSVTGLHKHYVMGDEDLHVLRGVEMSVGQGEWVSIVGSSGSGKSTLLHLMGALDHPDKGQVLFEGSNVFTMGGRAIDCYRNQRVGFVFQFYHLLPEMTALENVMVAAMIDSSILGWAGRKSVAHQRATDLLGKFGLSKRLKHRPSKLSGGERQRVAIARALMNEPAVLLADEPTGNLDAKTGGQIIDVLRQLHGDGQAIVMVTHDEEIAAAADRRLMLDAGKLQT